MGNIAKVFTCDPFPVTYNPKNKNNEKNKKERRIEG